MGPQVGDLLAFQPSVGAEQGPRVLFCEVPSRWRHGPQETACPCAERWFLSCRQARLPGRGELAKGKAGISSHLSETSFLISFPASGSENY